MELRTYETIFVMDPQLDQSKIDEFVDKIVEMITSSGGEIIKRDYWGKRRLAYEIRKRQYGFYIYILYRSDGKIIEPMEREFRLNENILRFMTVKLSKPALRQLERELRKAREEAPTAAKPVEEKAAEEKPAEEKPAEETEGEKAEPTEDVESASAEAREERSEK
jgi:small subunit ribosomal protein S6